MRRTYSILCAVARCIGTVAISHGAQSTTCSTKQLIQRRCFNLCYCLTFITPLLRLAENMCRSFFDTGLDV